MCTKFCLHPFYFITLCFLVFELRDLEEEKEEEKDVLSDRDGHGA